MVGGDCGQAEAECWELDHSPNSCCFQGHHCAAERAACMQGGFQQTDVQGWVSREAFQTENNWSGWVQSPSC